MPAAFTVGMFAMVVVLLLMTGNAFAHGVEGGFGGTSPNYGFAFVIFGASGFGIVALIVKRVGLRLSVGLLGSSLLILVLSWSDYLRLGFQSETLDSMTVLYFSILPYVIGASLVGSVGGMVLTGYHFLAVRPYLKYKVTK